MIRSLTAIVLLGLAAAVWAQDLPKLKPGAWELTTDMEGGGGPPPEMLAKMPPQVAEAMKKSMNQPRPPEKHCATPQDQDYLRAMQERMGMDMKCTNSPVKRIGSTYNWTSACTGTSPMGGGAMKIDAEHSLVYDGGDRFQSNSRIRSEGMGPMGGTRTTKTSGRFLGLDCKAHGALTMQERMRDLDSMRKPRPQK